MNHQKRQLDQKREMVKLAEARVPMKLMHAIEVMTGSTEMNPELATKLL